MTLFADLPGVFSLSLGTPTGFLEPRELEVVLVEQDLGFGRYAGWLPLPRRLLDEISQERGELEDLIENGLAHVFRPWAFRDEPDFLDFFDPVPRLSRALELARRVPILARSSKRRWDVLDDAAYIAARRLRRAADRLDERFEQRRTST